MDGIIYRRLRTATAFASLSKGLDSTGNPLTKVKSHRLPPLDDMLRIRSIRKLHTSSSGPETNTFLTFMHLNPLYMF